MLVRQFVYGAYLQGMVDKCNTLESVVEYLEECIAAYGYWGNVEGLSCVTGLPSGRVEYLIKRGSVYCA